MNQLSFFDKIQILFKLLFSSPIIIGIFAFSLILMITLFFSSKLNRKLVKYIFIFIYLLVIGFSIFKYGSYFLTSIDSFLTLFMANIYFPIIPIYVAIMVISFIIMIVTLSGRHKSRFIKVLNIIFFTLIQMLFVVFIYVIESNNIDLSTNTGLYSNDQTMTLLELGMGLFVVWVILLFVIFYLKKADKIFKVKKPEEQNDFDEYINDYNVPTKIISNDNLKDLGSDVNKNGLSSISNDEEVLSFDDVDVSPIEEIKIDDSINDVFHGKSSSYSNTKTSDIFSNFDFLNRPVERKNDDVEIIDFE